MNKLFFIIIFFALISFSCFYSTRTESESEIYEGYFLINRAVEYFRFTEYEHSISNYKLAFEKFTLLNNSEGKFFSSIGLVKAYIKAGKFDEAKLWLSKAETLISKKSFNDIYLASLSEFLFNSNQHKLLIDTFEDKFNSILNKEYYGTAVCYKILSLLKTKVNYQSEFNNLIAVHTELMNDISKVEEPLNLSFINYTIGYLFTKEKNWNKAKEYFSVSIKIDEKTSNYSGVADNLFAIAKCFNNLGKIEDAVSYFENASDVFKQLKNEEYFIKSKYESLLLKMKINPNDKKSNQELLELQKTINETGKKLE